MRQVKVGSTDITHYHDIADSGDGTPETGVTSASGGLALSYVRNRAAAVGITESDLAAADSAHSDGGMFHVGNGTYRVDWPDAAFAAGVDTVELIGTVTGMVVFRETIQLVGYNPRTELTAAVLALIDAEISSRAEPGDVMTINQTGTAIAAALDGSELNIQRGDKIEFTQTIGAITGWTKLYFYLKEAKDTADNDALIWMQVSSTPDAVNDGLKRLNGAASTLSYGTLTVADASTGEVDFVLLDTASISLVSQENLYYGWKWVDADGDTYTKAMGRANINEAIGEAIT